MPTRAPSDEEWEVTIGETVHATDLTEPYLA